MGSRLVEQETAAYLKRLLLSQLHLVEQIDRELCSLLLVHLPPKTRALKKGNRDHIIMKLPGLLTMRSDDDSVEEVANASVVDLDCQVLYDLMLRAGIKHDLPNQALSRREMRSLRPPYPISREKFSVWS